MSKEPKNGDKKNFPGFLIIFIIGVILLIAFQNFSSRHSAGVSYSHQAEHLVNLDLLDPDHSKKVALNDNLVSFTGTFKDELSETAKDRFRFLYLLDQNHILKARRDELKGDLAKLKENVLSSVKYFYSIVGLEIPSSGIFLVKGVDEPVILYPFAKEYDGATLRDLKSYADNNNLSANDLLYYQNQLLSLTSAFRSSKLGIGKESLKQKLRSADETLSRASTVDLAEKKVLLDSVYSVLLSIENEVLSVKDSLRFTDLRAMRDYSEYLYQYELTVEEVNKNALQLDKAQAKVASAVWFFNNQELTTKALMQKSPEEYHQWFAGAQKEWSAFAQNQGLNFKAPDQPRNAVLDKRFKSEEPSPNYFSYFFTFLPIILIGLFLYFIFSRQMKGMGSNAMNFGKSPAKMLHKETQKVTFDDVAGVEEAKEELEEIVDFLKDPGRFMQLGARIPKGVLLVGPPGTGKTLIAKAVAGEAGVPFFSISGSDFVEMFVGVGASRVRDLFDQARKSSPCIIFIDEIDAVGRHRGSGLGGGHDEREQTLNQLLVEIDGMDSKEGVILIAATNRPDVLDKALLRPGRFDRSVTVNVPDYGGRLAILKVHLRKVKAGEDVDLKEIALRTQGLAGAELEAIINEAALYAARKRRRFIIQDDLRYAQDKVQFGKERKSLKMEEEDLKTTAWHEGGHALLSLVLKSTDPVQKATIIPRGQSLGATHYALKKNRVSYRKKELLDKLVILMGGRVAEEMIDGDYSNGAMGDIQQATQYARAMVCEWGMSEKIGMINYGDNEGNLMAGFQEREYSEETARQIDEEVKNFINQGYQRAKQILQENKDKLELIANMLLKYETLDREDLDKIMDGTWSEEEKNKKMELFEAKQQKSPPPLPPSVEKKKRKFGGTEGPQPVTP